MQRFVQFPHPGREAGPDRQAWPRADADHRRKFVVAQARYRRSIDGPDEHGLVTAWVEWEAASECRERPRSGLAGLPEWVHRPIAPARSPAHERIPQNTDPLVFGEPMLTTFCRQPGSRRLRAIGRGSVLVFGSRVRGAFVIDTALVVAETVRHERTDYRARLAGKIDPLAIELTLEPMYAHRVTGPFNAMLGASPQEPVDGMFSFVPCLPVDDAIRGFARPDVGAIKGLNPNNWRAAAFNDEIGASEFPGLWRHLAERVLGDGLSLATRLNIPPDDVFARSSLR